MKKADQPLKWCFKSTLPYIHDCVQVRSVLVTHKQTTTELSEYKVTGPEIIHVKVETEFWEGDASWNIFSKFFLKEKSWKRSGIRI